HTFDTHRTNRLLRRICALLVPKDDSIVVDSRGRRRIALSRCLCSLGFSGGSLRCLFVYRFDNLLRCWGLLHYRCYRCPCSPPHSALYHVNLRWIVMPSTKLAVLLFPTMALPLRPSRTLR